MSDMAQGPWSGGALDPPPGRVLVAGDWHGDRDWALSVIKRVPQLLAGEQTRLILHLGDFGIWPGVEGRRYLDSVSAVLDLVDAHLWFIDGNHEDFPQLAQMASGTVPGGRVAVRPNICHLPRGHRWQWRGRTWLACGGGVSLDKAGRTERVDWWPQEEITSGQEATQIAGGHAEVMAHLMHGHLHRAYQRSCDFGYGPVQVTGLAAEGSLRNFAVLDVESITWKLRRRGLLDILTGHT